MSREPSIYLDYHATTPCDPQVVDAMLPYFRQDFGNPSSASHRPGRLSAQAVDRARGQVAALIHAQAREIVFTSGATESNNLAILGLARGASDNRRRIVTTAVEHKAVLQPCIALRRQGFDVTILPVSPTGKVNLAAAHAAITDETLLVSIQAASNEIGTIQDLATMTKWAHEHGAFVHTDAAQAVGKIPVDVDEWNVDLLSISAHKLYGPKGVGALYVRGGPYALPLEPLVYGGGQEQELRPGTLNVPGIVGLGKACELCLGTLPKEARRVAALRDQLEALLMSDIPDLRRNGALDDRLPGNSSLTFVGLDADAIIAHAPDLALSTGSACTSGALEPSHVLQAIGLSRQEAYSTIRVGLGRFTTEDEIRQAAGSIAQAVKTVRSLAQMGAS